MPDRTMAQLRSTPDRVAHHAAVLLPFADPSDRHCRTGPLIRMWPVEAVPRRPPSSRTSSSRASSPLACGQGCPDLHVPSISRAAIPASRIRGPSAHQIGPSPSQTCVGVQVKVVPAATTEAMTSQGILWPIAKPWALRQDKGAE